VLAGQEERSLLADAAPAAEPAPVTAASTEPVAPAPVAAASPPEADESAAVEISSDTDSNSEGEAALSPGAWKKKHDGLLLQS
jgi:hypothetical protein